MRTSLFLHEIFWKMRHLKAAFFFSAFWLLSIKAFSQTDSTTVITFDFNDHEIREKNNKISIRPVGVSLTYDRFGNKASAVYIHGGPFSYLNLGTSPLLKPRAGTISLWFNIEKRIHLGKGYDNTPFIFTRNSEREDFYDAYTMGYEPDNKRIGAAITYDSTREAVLRSADTISLNKWYHVAVTFDDHHMTFYVNGKPEGTSRKDFSNVYLATDSVVVGILSSRKNQRFMLGMVDDLMFYHRVLSKEEVAQLYEAENPNRTRQYLIMAGKFLLVLLGVALVIIILLLRNRRVLKKQKESLELSTRISQLELKAVKAQMNPHFISNCLVSVQNLIYSRKVEEAGLYVARFSYFLRQVLKFSDENYISMSEEKEMIQLYVELEQLRFDSKFSFSLISDDTMDEEEISVPALISQPFIENAIWHGLLPLAGKREPQLTVRFITRHGHPVIEIEDNGVGRDLQPTTKTASKGTRLAMEKIESLNRLSGTGNYSIEIHDLMSSGEKTGTKVIIRLS